MKIIINVIELVINNPKGIIDIVISLLLILLGVAMVKGVFKNAYMNGIPFVDDDAKEYVEIFFGLFFGILGGLMFLSVFIDVIKDYLHSLGLLLMLFVFILALLGLVVIVMKREKNKKDEKL